MRVAFSFLVFLIASSGDAALAGSCSTVAKVAFAGLSCSYDEGYSKATTQTPNSSSFRGISLSSTPEEVKEVAKSLGLEADTMFYVGSDSLVSGINIYRDCEEVGSINFDRNGRVLRLSLKDGFFCPQPIFVRRFAEQVFEHYEVKPVTEKDDVCFQDVTCFKGISKFGEHFLIMRIGTTAELYVRP